MKNIGIDSFELYWFLIHITRFNHIRRRLQVMVRDLSIAQASYALFRLRSNMTMIWFSLAVKRNSGNIVNLMVEVWEENNCNLCGFFGKAYVGTNITFSLQYGMQW